MKPTFKQFIQLDEKVDTTGFKWREEEDREEDNRKLFNYITTPDGKEHWIDRSPYDPMTNKDFQKYVAYYKEHGKFPKREQFKELK